MPNNKYAREVLSEDYHSLLFVGRFFDLTQLQRFDDIARTTVFGEEDFACYSVANAGRTPVTAKLGKLLITFCPDGKDGYDLNIQIIDRAQQQTRPLFLYRGNRYPSFTFEDLVPTYLDTNYPSRTITGHPSRYGTPELRAAYTHLAESARRVKACLVELALGHTQNQFPAIAAEFFAAKHTHDAIRLQHQPQLRIQPQAIPANFWDPVPRRIDVNQDLDVQEFTQETVFATRKPRTEVELAAKLAASYYLILGVDDAQFKQVIGEYLTETNQAISAFDETMIQRLLGTLIDRGRYPFQTVVPEDPPGATLRRLIEEIKQAINSQQPAISPPQPVISLPQSAPRTFGMLIATFAPQTEAGKVVKSVCSKIDREITRFRSLAEADPIAKLKLDLLVSYQTQVVTHFPEAIITDTNSQRLIQVMLQQWKKTEQENQAREVLHQDRNTSYAALRGLGFITCYLLPLIAFVAGLVAKQSMQTGREWAAVFAPRGLGLFGSQTRSERTLLSVVDSLESQQQRP